MLRVPRYQSEPGDNDSHAVCGRCPSARSCQTLIQAMEELRLAAERARDTYSQETYRDLAKRILDYGYAFPEGVEACWLADKTSVVDDLVKEARHRTEELERRQKAHG